MKELRLSDAELQRLLATALKSRLRQEGFRFENDEAAAANPATMTFPVRLDLCESTYVQRDFDGMWTFQQIDPVIERRLEESHIAHAEAMGVRESPLNRES